MKEEIKTIGLNDLQNVCGMAVLKNEKEFARKMRDKINSRIQIEISKEDYDHIMNNYTENL